MPGWLPLIGKVPAGPGVQKGFRKQLHSSSRTLAGVERHNTAREITVDHIRPRCYKQLRAVYSCPLPAGRDTEAVGDKNTEDLPLGKALPSIRENSALAHKNDLFPTLFPEEVLS